MTVFDQPGLLLRNPRGGVEDVDQMRAAGFHWLMVNIGDHPPGEWAVIRSRAANHGMACGPWLHTRQPDGRFSPAKLEFLIETADSWGSPLIVNSEKEIDGSGDACTGMIAEEVGSRDAAISMEAWLFNPPSVDWFPVGLLPMLLQIFPQEFPPRRKTRTAARNTPTSAASTASTSPSAPTATLSPAGTTCRRPTRFIRPMTSGRATTVNGRQPAPASTRPATAATRTEATRSWQAKEQPHQPTRRSKHWYDSSAKPGDWRRDNPGEWADIQAYRGAAPGTPAPTSIKSHTGLLLLELIEARRYAEGEPRMNLTVSDVALIAIAVILGIALFSGWG